MPPIPASALPAGPQAPVFGRWRAAAVASGGRARSSGLSLSVLDENCFLPPCLYEEEKQRDFVRSIIGRVMHENEGRLKNGDDGLDASTAGAKLNAQLLAYAAMLKHQSFKAEKEWRISGLFSCQRFEYRPRHVHAHSILSHPA